MKMKSFVRKLKNIYKNLKYADYNSTDFRYNLKKAGVKEGDSLYIMCSANNIKQKTNRTPPVHKILKDVLKVIGEKGTLMTLAFPMNRDQLISGEEQFHWKKSISSNGIFTELIRRKKESIRSLNPIYNVVAYGPKANEYCKDHHKDIYPFGEYSPYRKIIDDEGKYLGIGVGFEAFTMVHVVDDYYKEKFIHKLYKEVKKFKVQGKYEKIEANTYIRKSGQDLREALPNGNGKNYFKKLQPISYKKIKNKKTGIDIFAMDLKSFFDAALKNYEKNKLTWWNTEV